MWIRDEVVKTLKQSVQSITLREWEAVSLDPGILAELSLIITLNGIFNDFNFMDQTIRYLKKNTWMSIDNII